MKLEIIYLPFELFMNRPQKKDEQYNLKYKPYNSNRASFLFF